MSIVTARGLVETRVSAFTDLPLYYPADGRKRPIKGGKGWASVNVQIAREAAAQLEIGADSVVFRHPGLLLVSIFTPPKAGDEEGMAHGETISVLFRRKKETSGTTSVLYRAPTVRPIGPAGEFWQTDCEIPFRADVIYTIAPT